MIVLVLAVHNISSAPFPELFNKRNAVHVLLSYVYIFINRPNRN